MNLIQPSHILLLVAVAVFFVLVFTIGLVGRKKR